MMISSVRLEGFRSYSSGEFSFKDGANIVCGPNGVGKTNLLEGILLLSGAGSWRTRRRGELISFDAQSARLVGRTRARGRDFTLTAAVPLRGRSVYTSNGVTLKRQFELSDYFRCVVFSPEDLELVRGGAEKRRRFIDTALTQLRPRYGAILSEYNKVLEMKQYVLREGPRTMLRDINERMIHFGADIIGYRARFIDGLRLESEIIHREMAGGYEKLDIAYRTVSTVTDPFAEPEKIRRQIYSHLADHARAEEESRQALTGPHRDELEIFINGKSARSFASQGQARTAALALKFGEREIFRQDAGELPVLLLDDVLSELDPSRAEYVASAAVGGQTIITCCAPPGSFHDADVQYIGAETKKEGQE